MVQRNEHQYDRGMRPNQQRVTIYPRTVLLRRDDQLGSDRFRKFSSIRWTIASQEFLPEFV